jgi:phage shock protein A
MSETSDREYTDSGVPTFESVREKIENRSGVAAGASELDAESDEGRQLDAAFEARKRAAVERLQEIRESMRDTSTD